MAQPDIGTWRPETLAVHQGVFQDTAFNSVTTPIYPSSTFAFERVGVHKGFDYTRSGNPTRRRARAAFGPGTITTPSTRERGLRPSNRASTRPRRSVSVGRAR